MQVDEKEPFRSLGRTMKQYEAITIDVKRLMSVAMATEDFIKPVFEQVDRFYASSQFRELSRHIKETTEAFTKMGALTLPNIRVIDNLYASISDASKVLAPIYGVPEEKREEVVVRPILKETKIQIRSRVPSIKEIIPLNLPLETKWEDIQMRFIDKHTVFIKIPKYKVKLTVDYDDMGMRDGRTDGPNAQWTVLCGLAKYNREISWHTPIANPRIKKQKQLLSIALKRYFGIKEDPFMVYRTEKAYRLKMMLIPNEELEKRNKLGINEYLEETTPKVYDVYENAGW